MPCTRREGRYFDACPGLKTVQSTWGKGARENCDLDRYANTLNTRHSTHGHVIVHATVSAVHNRYSTTTTTYKTYKSTTLGSATMDAPSLNPLAVKLPPPPTDPTVHLPLAPHSPPLVEDVLQAIQYSHQVDVSHCMLVI